MSINVQNYLQEALKPNPDPQKVKWLEQAVTDEVLANFAEGLPPAV